MEINKKPISHWGLKEGAINSTKNGMSLSGQFSLPKRLGKTYHDWQGVIEPYVSANDIHFDGRDLTLSLVMMCDTTDELYSKINLLKQDLSDTITITDSVCGTFIVGLVSVDVTEYWGGWASLSFQLREVAPVVNTTLPTKDSEALQGIDGYGWGVFGFKIISINKGCDITKWNELNVTKNPLHDSWVDGYRSAQEISINGKVIASSYAEFKQYVDNLHAVISASGVRRLRYESLGVNCFCVDGISVDVVLCHGDTFWADVEFKMVVTNENRPPDI